jgi:hypothetical protein
MLALDWNEKSVVDLINVTTTRVKYDTKGASRLVIIPMVIDIDLYISSDDTANSGVVIRRANTIGGTQQLMLNLSGDAPPVWHSSSATVNVSFIRHYD